MIKNWCTVHKQILKGEWWPSVVKYLVIAELTIATLFVWVFVMRHHMSCCQFLWFSTGITCHAVSFFGFPPGSLVASWKTIEPTAALLLHTNRPSAVPVKFPNYNDSATRIAENYGFLLCAQGTICVRPRGSPWSSPLRTDGSWDDQAGEAGPVEL